MKEKIDTSINQLHVKRDEYRDRLIIADSRQALVKIPEKTFQMCVTSPPYWGLRDYNMDGQIGAEETIHEFIKDLVEIFREVRRTLKDDGLLWLNIGDSFTSGGRSWRDKDKKNPARGMSYRAPTPEGLKPKDLIGLPWRLALALQDDGWYLRSDNIWYKPNCQPESVKDRPTRSHEYVFLLSKSEKYYYDHESVKEPTSDGRSMRNRRTVWEVKTKPFKGAHFAVYPPELVEICVKAGSREGDVVLDPFFGSGTTGIVSRELGRSYYGIELNPDYAKIAIERLQGVDPQLEMGI
ncbi:DNA-methyltransferase [Vibrio alfacsensis]|uniref:DNA-methyltransferase n=1 Tax=Vibrio alfacsensis TaxID=1074311 RepID=UPI0040676466